LGELLRAVQRRQQLINNQGATFYALDQQLYDSGGTPPQPPKLIYWPGLDAFPTDAEVNALPIDAQFHLLEMARLKVFDLAYQYADPQMPGVVPFQNRIRDVDDTSFTRTLQSLARVLSQIVRPSGS
jgi:hypothetical protein